MGFSSTTEYSVLLRQVSSRDVENLLSLSLSESREYMMNGIAGSVHCTQKSMNCTKDDHQATLLYAPRQRVQRGMYVVLFYFYY